MMSLSGWFIVVVALLGANLPFVNQRILAILPTPGVAPGARKRAGWRIGELIVLYCVTGLLGFALEAQAGNRFEQGWQFYAITFSLFVVFAFPGFVVQYLIKRHTA
jgi:hypothetical protein